MQDQMLIMSNSTSAFDLAGNSHFAVTVVPVKSSYVTMQIL